MSAGIYVQTSHATSPHKSHSASFPSNKNAATSRLCFYPGKPTRNAVSKDFIQNWPHWQPLPSMYQNSAFFLQTERDSEPPYQLRKVLCKELFVCQPSFQMLAKSQSCKQAFLRIAVQAYHKTLFSTTCI